MSASFTLDPEAIAGGARQAALALHAAGENDRAWLLAQLAPPERQVLEALLAELARLGIPRDPALGGVASTLPPARNAAERADAKVLASMLRREPPELGAMVLGTLSPSHRRAVASRLPSSTRAASEAHLPETLRGALLDEIARRAPPTEARPPWWRRWLPQRGARS